MIYLPYIYFLSFLSLIITKYSRYRELHESNNRRVHLLNFMIVVGFTYFIIFTSFRVIDISHGGIDAWAYKTYFILSDTNYFDSIVYKKFEPGFAFLMWLIRKITDDYQYFLVLIYTFIFYVLNKFVRRMYVNSYVFFSVVLLLGLVINSFNTLRVILSVFISLLFYIKLSEKNYMKSFLLIILAVSIHISAIILFPMFLIHWILAKAHNMNFIKQIFLVIVLIFFVFISLHFAMPFISHTKYGVYLNNPDIAFPTYIIALVILLLSIYKYDEMCQLNNFNETLIKILPVVFSVMILQYKVSIFYRMVLFFLPIIYAMIPSLLEVYNITRINFFPRIAVRTLLLFYLLSKIYVLISVELSSAGLPYLNYLLRVVG